MRAMPEMARKEVLNAWSPVKLAGNVLAEDGGSGGGEHVLGGHVEIKKYRIKNEDVDREKNQMRS